MEEKKKKIKSLNPSILEQEQRLSFLDSVLDSIQKSIDDLLIIDKQKLEKEEKGNKDRNARI